MKQLLTLRENKKLYKRGNNAHNALFSNEQYLYNHVNVNVPLIKN